MVNEAKMMAKNKEKLQQDLKKYCKQIGVSEEEIPRLIVDKKEMLEVGSKWGYEHLRLSNNYGVYYGEHKTIFVDLNRRIYHPKRYPVKEYKHKPRITKKTTYLDFRHTLIHELVHHRWKSIPHGVKFEQRIKEILRGKTFPLKQLYT